MQETKFTAPNLSSNVHLVKLAIFDNNVIKCYFDDNTSIIIYNNYNFITYFLSNNQIVKLSLKSPISFHNLNSKLSIAIKIINKFSTCIYPYKNFYDKEEIYIFGQKINDFRWYIADDFFSEDNDGFSINSIDNLCVFKILKNLRFVIVEYFHQISEVKSGYQYIRVQKVFSISQIPDNWIIPLQLLVLRYNLTPLKKFLENHNLLFEIDRKEFISIIPQQESCSISNEEDTDINPLVFIFSKINRLKLLYTEEYTYFVTINELQILHNKRPLLELYTKNEMNIIYYQFDYKEEIKNVELNSFMKVTNAFSKEEVNIFKVAEIVLEVNEIKKFYKPYTIIDSKNRDNKDSNKKDNDFSFNYDEIFKFKEIPDIGSFYSFANKTIKINFVDRTILKLNSELDHMIITDKFGENFKFNLLRVGNDFPFKMYHLYYALQFYNWCFSDNETKRRVHENVEMINQLSQKQINQNVIFNTVSNISKIKSTSIPEDLNKVDINQIIAKNNEFLKSIKKYK